MPMATPDAGTAGRFEQTVMPYLDAAYNLARWPVRSRAMTMHCFRVAVAIRNCAQANSKLLGRNDRLTPSCHTISAESLRQFRLEL